MKHGIISALEQEIQTPKSIRKHRWSFYQVFKDMFKNSNRGDKKYHNEKQSVEE